MKTVFRRIILLISVAFLAAILMCSCGKSDSERLCEHPWESAVGFIEFKESGKICYNFESEDTSVSYYKLLSGSRINMYTEEGEQLGMIFDYRFEDDALYIGQAKYTKAELIEFEDSETVGNGTSNPEDYPEVSYNNEENVQSSDGN